MSLILLGLLNAQAAGGAAGSYDLLETQVLTSTTTSITFSGLGSYTDYKHLQIRAVTQTAIASTFNFVTYLKINNDSGTNYAWHELNGNGSGVFSQNDSSTSLIDFDDTSPGSDATNQYGAQIVDILDFSNTNKNTTVRALTGHAGAETDINLYSGLWNNTSAVTSINYSTVGSGFTAGSRFSLYGIKGA